MLLRLFTRRAALVAGALTLAAAGAARWVIASDHRDSALLTANPAEDIADAYTFQSPASPSNVVFAVTVSGFIPPAEAGTTYFDPSVLYQIKIDTNGDAVEDLVVQAFVTGNGSQQVMHFIGPVKPDKTGNLNRVQNGQEVASVPVSHGATPTIVSRRGMSFFAGVRDDPFFFDLVQFKHVVAGEASSFRNPGVDTFAGFNILALVIELPKSLLGTTGAIGVWATTSRAN